MKRWLPTIFFLFSIGVSILENNDDRFYLIYLSAVILMFSAIWNFVKERIIVGFIELMILLIAIFFFSLGVFISMGVEREYKNELSVKRRNLESEHGGCIAISTHEIFVNTH